MAKWISNTNMAGYLPDGEPYEAGTWGGAKSYLLDELDRDLDFSDDYKVCEALQATIMRLHDRSRKYTCVAFAPKSSVLIAGSESGSVELWDTQTKKPIAVISPHVGRVQCLAPAPGGKCFASAGGDMNVRRIARGDLTHERRKVYAFFIEMNFAPGEASHIEKVVDDTSEMLELPLHDLDLTFTRGRTVRQQQHLE